MTERNGERAPERTYILTERQFLDAVLKGALAIGVIPEGPLELERARVHRADNGGLVIHLWLPAALSPEVALGAKDLHRMLTSYAAELPGPVPTLKEISDWSGQEQLEVSAWVRELHRQAHPIAGVTPPPLEHDPPDVLLTARGEVAKPSKKKAGKRGSRTAPAELEKDHQRNVEAELEAEEAEST